jgi:spore germination protein
MKSSNHSKKGQTNQNKDKNDGTQMVISPRQATALIASTIIGTGVLTLPSEISRRAHEASWLAMLIGTFITVGLMFLITKLALRFPKQTIVEYAPILLGTKKSLLIGKIVSLFALLPILVIWFSAVIFTARTFGEVVISSILPETPLEVIIATMIGLASLLVFYEVEVVARFNEIVFPVILVPILLIVLSSLGNMNITNLLPVFTVDWRSILQGILSSTVAFQGFSIMLIFMAFTQKEANVASNLTGIAIPGFLYIIIVTSSVAVFGYEELELLTWATLELIKTTEVPGLVLERLESAFLGVWVAAVYTTVGNIYYAGCFALSQLIPMKNKNKGRKILAVVLLPLMFWTAMLPHDIFQLFQMSTYLGYLSFFPSLIIPIAFIALAIGRRKGKEIKKDG